MAKLSGVKTIDMVNGEITKVSYNGAEYALVGDKAQKGDLLLSKIKLNDVDKGEFYECTGAYLFGINFRDDGGSGRDRNHGEFEVFRKISASSPTIEERVTALEADVAAIKGVTITFEGEQYRKVERKAQAGDVVTINREEWREHGMWADLTEGRPYKIAYSGGLYFEDDVADSRDIFVEFPETVDVYEKVAEAKAVEAPYTPQKGDIVVVTANNTGSHNKIGDIGKVGTEKPLRDGGVCVYVPKGHTSSVRTLPKDIRPATPAEVAAYERAVAKTQFKIGDYVKIVKSDRGKEGTIAKITEYGEGRKHRLKNGTLEPSDFVINVEGDPQDYGIRYDQIVKATAKEITKAEEIAKWAKIGRKPGEFKKGDVVNAKRGGIGQRHEYGIIEDVAVGEGFGVRFANNDYRAFIYDEGATVELIAPVDARFDK